MNNLKQTYKQGIITKYYSTIALQWIRKTSSNNVLTFKTVTDEMCNKNGNKSSNKLKDNILDIGQ